MTEFEKILKELQAMHDKKQADYGAVGDPVSYTHLTLPTILRV